MRRSSLLFATCVREQRLASEMGHLMSISRKLVQESKLDLLAVHAGMIPRPWKVQSTGKAAAGNGSKGGGPAAPKGAAGSYAWCLRN
jgi:hypothetical protein